MKRSAIHTDPEKVRAWQQRSRRRLPPKSDRRRALELAEDRPAVRAAVFLRDGICALRVLDPTHRACFGPPTFHHLRKSSAQGPYTAANGLRLCAIANEGVEIEPAKAKALGLVVNHEISADEARRRRRAHGWDRS